MPFIAYKITHRESGKAYIGITTQKRPEVRWRHHINVGRRGLGAAIKKYGEGAFSFDIVASSWREDDLLALETILIEQDKTLSPNGYNLNIGGKGTLRAAEETRKLIGEANRRRVWTAESREKVSKALTGQKMPPSHSAKRSAYMTGRKPSAETRVKLSDAAKKRSASPIWKAAIIASNKNRHVSEATKAKIAAGVARYAAKTKYTPLQMELI